MHVQMRDTFAEVAGTGERERAAVGRALNQQRARDALRSKHRLDVLGVIAYPASCLVATMCIALTGHRDADSLQIERLEPCVQPCQGYSYKTSQCP